MVADNQREVSVRDGLVSVVMPSFNSAAHISESMDSALAQGWRHLELIVVDDASTDNTREIVRSKAKADSRIQLIECTVNGGAGKARNRAIETAGGRYIAFLDSDDTWAPNKLEHQIAVMTREDAALSCTGYSMRRADGTHRDVVPPPKLTHKDILSGCDIGCLTVVVDLKKIGKKIYMRDIRIRQDYLLWFDLMAVGGAFTGIPKVLATRHVREGSLSGNKFSAARFQWIAYRKELRMGRLSAAYYFCRYAWHGVSKYWL